MNICDTTKKPGKTERRLRTGGVMIKFMRIGSTPWGTNCVQIDRKKNYLPEMKAECERYIEMLQRRFGDVFDETGVSLVINKYEHSEFGPYYEVAVRYDEKDRAQDSAARFISDNKPEVWDDNEVFNMPLDHDEEVNVENNDDYDEEDSYLPEGLEEAIDMERAMREKKYYINPPHCCDLCKSSLYNEKYFVDGVVRGYNGAAGFMCLYCFEEQGVKVAWGFGQLYMRQDNEKWLLVGGFRPEKSNKDDI